MRGLLSRYRPLNHQQGAPITDNSAVCVLRILRRDKRDLSALTKTKRSIFNNLKTIGERRCSLDKYSSTETSIALCELPGVLPNIFNKRKSFHHLLSTSFFSFSVTIKFPSSFFFFFFFRFLYSRQV